MLSSLEPSKRYFLTMFTVSCALLVVYACAIYRQSQVLNRRSASVLESWEVLKSTRMVLVHALHMESSQRGYLLSGAEAYLEPYRRAITQLDAALQRLAALAAGDPAHAAHSEALQAQADAMKETIERHRLQVAKRAVRRLTVADLDESRRRMDSLRETADRIIEFESNRLQARGAAAAGQQRRYQQTLFMGAVLSVAALVAANMLIYALLSRGRRTEQELLQSEERFRIIMNGLHACIYDFDLVKGTAYFSAPCKRMLGYADHEYPDSPEGFMTLMHPDDIARSRAAYAAFARRQVPAYRDEFRLRHKDGGWRWVLCRGVGLWDAKGCMYRLVGSHTDITEQKEREEELRQLNSDMEGFTHISSHDLRGFATEMRHAVDVLLPLVEKAKPALAAEDRRKLEAVLQQDIPESLGFVDAAVTRMDKLTSAILDMSRSSGRRAYRMQLMDRLTPVSHSPPAGPHGAGGDERDALLAMEKAAADFPVKDPGQFYLELLPAIMQAAYTGDRLSRENEMQKHELLLAKEKAEQASKAKSEFLATMSHEIRTPMNAVIGLSRLLAHTRLDARQKEMVETLSTSADLLLKLINDLLDLSRIESGQVEFDRRPFTVSGLFKDVHSMFAGAAEEKSLTLTLEDLTHGAELEGDRTRIQQIVTNLISNALKFTAQGGVTVVARCENGPEGAELWITVSDTGIGIPAEKQAQIFDKFVQADQSITRRFGGSGLGLSICKTLVELMGGDIMVDSVEHAGSTFTMHLPVTRHAAAGAQDARAAAQGMPDRAQGAVLLVEDYPPNVMVATLMLENLGFTVEAAASGEKALARIRSSAQPYLAILMDVQMQDMDGFETTRRIREIERMKGFRQPILGVTAHALAGDRERCLEAGMDDYISKPIHPEILAQKLGLLAGADMA